MEPPDIDSHVDKTCLSHHQLETQSELRTNNTFCDARISLDDGGVIFVHRVILCASCDYFRALFTSILNDGEANDVRISCVSTELMQSIIDFAYSRNAHINEENVCDLIQLADYFGMNRLVALCVTFIVEMMRPQNCISLMLMSRWAYWNLYPTNLIIIPNSG